MMVNNPRGVPPGSPQNYNPQHPHYIKPQITEEDIKEFNNCIKGAVWKFGIPFAALIHLVTKFKNPKGSAMSPTPLPRSLSFVNGWKILGSIIFGTILYAPVCHSAFAAKVTSRHEKMLKEYEDQSKHRGLDELGTSSYQSDESGSNFSHLNLDLSQPLTDNLILEDATEEKTPSQPTTTYEDLRKRNRDSFFHRRPAQPPPPLRDETSFKAPVSMPEEKPFTSSKPVRRNKYGDEIDT